MRNAERLQLELSKCSNRKSEFFGKIGEAVNSYVSYQAVEILKTVPVDEINREKQGIRINALKAHSYLTVADVYNASVYAIESISGIGFDSAYKIKNISSRLYEEAKKNVKIKLSSDNRNAYSTALVKAVSVYKNSLPCFDRCQSMYNQNRENFNLSLRDVRPASNALRWIFSSRNTKENAVDAYNKLNEIMSGSYVNDAETILSELDKRLKMSDDDAWNDFASDNVRFFNVLENIAPGHFGVDNTVYGIPESIIVGIQEEPLYLDGLTCVLRHYQEWGVKYILHQKKVLLGDEMGLGKTVEAIAAMVSLGNLGATHFLVVCPAGILTNWCREIERHSNLKAVKVHGQDRGYALSYWKRHGGVAVTTYEGTANFNLYGCSDLSMVVVDEAHYIKNPHAERTKNTLRLCEQCQRLLFMTGTALENRVDEMLTLISFLKPAIAHAVQSMVFMSSAPQFREKIAPVYYRRKREDVLTELPEKIESREWCTLLPTEMSVYVSAVIGRKFMEARRVSWSVDDLNLSSKACALADIVESAEREDRKVIVYSYFLETIRKISLFLGERCFGCISGSVAPAKRQEIIDDFERAPAGTVLVAQIQTGGIGLNLQVASVVVICEPQLKPSAEAQAISRTYRMGQSRNVLVYRLLCENTIDERIIELLNKKQRIFNSFADKSFASDKILEIDDDALSNLFAQELENVNKMIDSGDVTL